MTGQADNSSKTGKMKKDKAKIAPISTGLK
jgi:hypothetical protein